METTINTGVHVHDSKCFFSVAEKKWRCPPEKITYKCSVCGDATYPRFAEREGLCADCSTDASNHSSSSLETITITRNSEMYVITSYLGISICETRESMINVLHSVLNIQDTYFAAIQRG